MNRVTLIALIAFVFTLAFTGSLMAAGYSGGSERDDTYMVKSSAYTSMTSNDLLSLEKQAQKLVGQSKDQLVTQLGKPGAVFTDKNKDQIYSYEIRLPGSSGPGRPHWLEENFVVNTTGTIVRVSTSEL